MKLTITVTPARICAKDEVVVYGDYFGTAVVNRYHVFSRVRSWIRNAYVQKRRSASVKFVVKKVKKGG